MAGVGDFFSILCSLHKHSHYACLMYHWHRLYRHLQAWNSFLHVCLHKDRGPWITWKGRPLLHLERSQLRWFGPRLGCLPDISLWEYCLNSQLGGDPWAKPEHTGGITYPIWPGKSSGSPRRSWRTWLGRKTLPRLLPLLIRTDGRIKPHSLSLSCCLWTLSRRSILHLMASRTIIPDIFLTSWTISLMCSI